MFYRENGQFKTTYRADQQIFPITQDRIAIALILAVAFLAVPMLASDYLFRAILIPFLIFSLAAIGVNILVGYCGQISLGSGAFMAVGAYGAYNFFVRIPGMPLIPALILGGLCATFFGILFGLPSLRVKGLYLAVATLAAQFFADWMFLRIKWFTNDSPSGSVSVSNLQVFGMEIETPLSKYFLCLGILVVIGLLAKNLVRGAIGREWMAIRDMDVAAAVIGIRPMYAKLSAFAVSSFIVGVAGALWGFVYLGAWEPAAFSVDQSFQAAVHGDHRRHGLDHGQLLWRGLHRGAADRAEPGAAGAWQPGRSGDFHGRDFPRGTDDFWRADRLVPDRRAPWPGQAVVHRQAEAAPVALPALIFESPFMQTPAHYTVPQSPGDVMKLRNIALATCLAAVGITAFAQAKEQFFPGLPYRTGPYAPNGVPWANGYADYLKLVNARGGINGVKIVYEECETAYDTARGVECYERLKGKHGGATVFQPLSTGITFALTEKAPGDKIPLITAGYGRSESQDGLVFKWNFPLAGTYWLAADALVQTSARRKADWTSSRARKSRWSTTTARMARNRSRCCRNAPSSWVSTCNCCR